MYSKEPKGDKDAKVTTKSGEKEIQDIITQTQEDKKICLKCVTGAIFGVSVLAIAYLLSFTAVAYAIP